MASGTGQSENRTRIVLNNIEAQDVMAVETIITVENFDSLFDLSQFTCSRANTTSPSIQPIPWFRHLTFRHLNGSIKGRCNPQVADSEIRQVDTVVFCPLQTRKYIRCTNKTWSSRQVAIVIPTSGFPRFPECATAEARACIPTRATRKRSINNGQLDPF